MIEGLLWKQGRGLFGAGSHGLHVIIVVQSKHRSEDARFYVLWKLAGVKWTRRWVVADDQQLVYYKVMTVATRTSRPDLSLFVAVLVESCVGQTPRRPPRGVAPRRVFPLHPAVIKELKLKDKPYSFSIEASNGYRMVFACDDVMELGTWLQGLQGDRADMNSEQSDQPRHHQSAEQLSAQARMLNDVSIIQEFFDCHSGVRAFVLVRRVPAEDCVGPNELTRRPCWW